MIKRSKLELDVAKYGDNIALTVPSVDRGRYDPRNLIGVVLAVNSDGSFKIGVKGGILKGTYLRTCFSLCSGKHLTPEDVPNKTLSLREATKVAP